MDGAFMIEKEEIMSQLLGVQQIIYALSETAEHSKTPPEALAVLGDVMDNIYQKIQACIGGAGGSKA